MATTPNYGFIMPDPTDFVTNLPADFEIFGDEVDSRIKALNPETTAGDISYRASTANAKTRLAIGTAGQVLTVNSGATAPEWTTVNVAAQTLLTSGNLSSGTTTISSISANYNDLILVVRSFDPATDGTSQSLRFNNDTGNTYHTGSFGSGGDSAAQSTINIQNSIDNGSNDGVCYLFIPQYSNTVAEKFCYSTYVHRHNTAGGVRAAQLFGFWQDTTAINRIDLFAASGNTDGGSYQLFGVK